MPTATPNPIDAPGTDELSWATWPGLRHLPAADIAGWTSAVVLAAHPDDEVLGAGGIMSALAAAGARLRLVCITDGEASHPGTPEPGALAQRRAEERAAALRVLGAEATEVIRLRLPDTGLDNREPEITALLTDLVAGFDVCLAPWHKDMHSDHEVVGRSARRASQQTMLYPVWMWHWAVPDDPRVPWQRAVRVPLPSAAAVRKRAAIRCLSSQLETRGATAGPVLSPGTIAHFTRDTEVLFQ
jgi:LmbE family N-acetylglucosaminyl deacetylase